jgi:ABC-type branched-subunit amino acid transport system substrate-binding protein
LKFRDEYEIKYNTLPQILNDVAYDALSIILKQTFEGKLKSGDELRESLTKMNEYAGASGNIKFDANGDVHKNMILKIIKNNKFEEVDSNE